MIQNMKKLLSIAMIFMISCSPAPEIKIIVTYSNGDTERINTHTWSYPEMVGDCLNIGVYQRCGIRKYEIVK